MIPGKILRFLEHEAVVAFAGTRDRDLIPHGHRVTGWRVGEDGSTMGAFIPTSFTLHLINSLEDNGQFALTVEAFPSHETYQFKGRYLRQRAVDRSDLDIVERIRDRFVRNVRSIYPDWPEPGMRAFITGPSLVIEFDVEEIYLQTPGPGAGSRLVPPAEA